MKRLLVFLMAAGIPSGVHARLPQLPFASYGTSAITVYGDRILFGDLSPTAPRAYLDLDIGPAPAPGRSAVVSRDAIRAALRRVGADEALTHGLPAQHTVVRAAIDLGQAQLHDEVVAASSEQLPVGISVREVLGLKPARLPTGDLRVEVKLGTLRRSTLATVLIHVDGRLVERQTATINLEGEAKTPTLRASLSRGAMVRADDVELAPADLERLPSGVVTRPSELVGKRLIQPANAGQPIQARALEVPPTIERGASVRVVLLGQGLRIARTAVAQENGNVGDTIRLKPADGDGMMRGQIVSATEVRMSIGGVP